MANPLYITVDDIKHKLSLPHEGVVFELDAPNKIFDRLKQRPYWEWIKSDCDIAEFRKAFNLSVIVGEVK